MLEWSEIVLRLGVATLAGGLIGLDRDLHGKPIGLKTLGLVGLATSMVVMLALPAGDITRISDATSRVIQGMRWKSLPISADAAGAGWPGSRRCRPACSTRHR